MLRLVQCFGGCLFLRMRHAELGFDGPPKGNKLNPGLAAGSTLGHPAAPKTPTNGKSHAAESQSQLEARNVGSMFPWYARRP